MSAQPVVGAVVGLLAQVALGALAAQPASAHPDRSHVVDELTVQIQRQCESASDSAVMSVSREAHSPAEHSTENSRVFTDDECGDLHLRRAEVLTLLGRVAAAAVDLERAAALGVPSAALHAARAALAGASGDDAAAEAWLRKALSSPPAGGANATSRSRLLRLRSDHAAHREDWRLAVSAAVAALAEAPQPSPELFLHAAKMQFLAGQPRQAISTLADGSARHPNVTSLIEAHLAALTSSGEVNGPSEALEVLSGLLECPCSDCDVPAAIVSATRVRWFERRADLLLQLNRPAEALRDYEAALGALALQPRARVQDRERLQIGYDAALQAPRAGRSLAPGRLAASARCEVDPTKWKADDHPVAGGAWEGERQ